MKLYIPSSPTRHRPWPRPWPRVSSGNTLITVHKGARAPSWTQRIGGQAEKSLTKGGRAAQLATQPRADPSRGLQRKYSHHQTVSCLSPTRTASPMRATRPDDERSSIRKFEISNSLIHNPRVLHQCLTRPAQRGACLPQYAHNLHLNMTAALKYG